MLTVEASEDGTLLLNGQSTSVFLADIAASNGVIHAIDGVLLPPMDEEMESEEMSEESMDSEMMGNTIVDVASGNEDFSTLVAAVDAAGLVETLSGEGPFTVFAPTNAAFEAALAELGLTAEELLADTETLTSILTFHVVGDSLMAEDIVAAVEEADGTLEVETVNGAPLTVEIVDGELALNGQGVGVAMADVEASNGVIHAIDGVLLPPME